MKILMVLTSHDRLGDTGHKTGFWLEEFASPYYVFKDAGAQITLASPKGGQPPIDPKSADPAFATPATQRFDADSALQARLADTLPLASVNAADYDAVVLCCGAKQARDIQAPGRDAQGIFFAVDYLTSVTRSLLDSNFADGKAVSAAGKRVLVIGGGDTGNDCVGTAIRQGCESVMQLEMMPCPPAARAPRQRLARVAPRAENRLRPAGGHCQIRL